MATRVHARKVPGIKRAGNLEQLAVLFRHAVQEDYRYNRFPNRLIIPLTRGSEGKGASGTDAGHKVELSGWRPKENGEAQRADPRGCRGSNSALCQEGEPDAPEAEGLFSLVEGAGAWHGS